MALQCFAALSGAKSKPLWLFTPICATYLHPLAFTFICTHSQAVVL
jgi:hypothetical protein